MGITGKCIFFDLSTQTVVASSLNFQINKNIIIYTNLHNNFLRNVRHSFYIVDELKEN